MPKKRGVEHAIQLHAGLSAATGATTTSPKREGRRGDEGVCGSRHQVWHAAAVRIAVRQMALIVPKKDGSPRFVVDYRALNEVTVKNRYPLPLMDELFDRTQGAQYFSSIDLRNGFHQIAIRPEDREKTAFRTRFGSFEYTRAADGPVQCARHVHAADESDVRRHAGQERAVLPRRHSHLQPHRGGACCGTCVWCCQRLREQELYVKREQVLRSCSARWSSSAIASAQMACASRRTRSSAVQQWPTPAQRDGCALIPGPGRLLSPLRQGLQQIALPLTELTKRSRAMAVGSRAAAAFAALKAALCSPPVLLIPDPASRSCSTATRASMRSARRCSRTMATDLQPVAYFSAKMSGAERNYDVREQEFMALMRACLHWRHYLHGTAVHAALRSRLAEVPQDHAEPHRPTGAVGREDGGVRLRAASTFPARTTWWRTRLAGARTTRRRAARSPPATGTKCWQWRGCSEQPESAEQRQRNIDAADQGATASARTRPRPNRQGVIDDTDAALLGKHQSGRAVRATNSSGALCWNHLRRDIGVRVQPSSVPGAGRGLFAAWPTGCQADHRIPLHGRRDRAARAEPRWPVRAADETAVQVSMLRVATAAWVAG